MISKGNLAVLKKEGLLDDQGHPTVDAYVKAINTVSSSCSLLCQELWNHVNECTICSQRAQEALNKTNKT